LRRQGATWKRQLAVARHRAHSCTACRQGAYGAWALWHTLAAKRPALGNPVAFDSSVADSTWESFTITTKDPRFFELMQEFSGSVAGKGGLITLKDSRWLITVVLNHQPHFRDQPDDTYVWWGYALFPDRAGDHVGKPMTECTGREGAETRRCSSRRCRPCIADEPGFMLLTPMRLMSGRFGAGEGVARRSSPGAG